MERSILDELIRIKAISDVGLLYAENEYDKERYTELREIVLRLLSSISNGSDSDIRIAFPLAKDYPTAKVDVRGILLNENREILLVKELDGKWSLPGGWADIGFSPTEVITKEFKEETGLEIVVDKLLAIFDKRKHSHPPQGHYVYKIVFYCKYASGTPQAGFDLKSVAFFPVNELPELSEVRILKSQIEQCVKIMDNGDKPHVD